MHDLTGEEMLRTAHTVKTLSRGDPLTDSEIYHAIRVLENLVDFFEIRGSSFDLIRDKLYRELYTCRDILHARKSLGR